MSSYCIRQGKIGGPFRNTIGGEEVVALAPRSFHRIEDGPRAWAQPDMEANRYYNTTEA